MAGHTHTAAIVLSGAYRTLPDCNASMVRHIIDANPSVRFHVYAHLTTEVVGADQQVQRDIWNSFPCVVGAALETNVAVSAGVRAEVPGTEKVPRGRGTAQGKAMNIIKMFRGIAAAQRLLTTQPQQLHHHGKGGESTVPGRLDPPPAVQNGARCAAAGPPRVPRGGYDLVIRLRPDLCFCGPLDLQPLLSRSGAAHHVWLPWWSAQLGWAFDQIAVGPPAAMTAYAQAYESTVRRLVAAKRELYPEGVMWEHLASLGPHLRLLRPLRGFQASLARSSPRFHLVDPYSKLKQDLAVVQPALAGSLPPYACSGATTVRTTDDGSNRSAVSGVNRSGHARGKRRGVGGTTETLVSHLRRRRSRSRQV